MRDLLLEGCDVDEWDDDYGAGYLGRVEHANQFLKRDDRGVLGPVRSRHQCKHRPGLSSVKNGDRDGGGRVDSAGNFDRAGDSLTSFGDRSADGEGGSLLRGGNAGNDQDD